MNGQHAPGPRGPLSRHDADLEHRLRLAEYAAKLPVTLDLGDTHATLDMFTLEIADRDTHGDPERTVPVPGLDVRTFAGELAYIVARGEPASVCLGRIDLHASPQTRAVTVPWSDYDIDERPVGGRVDLTFGQAHRLAAWARELPLPAL